MLNSKKRSRHQVSCEVTDFTNFNCWLVEARDRSKNHTNDYIGSPRVTKNRYCEYERTKEVKMVFLLEN